MTNEQYLIASYFTVGAICTALAAGVYLFLKNSFIGIIRHIPFRQLSLILKRLFLIGILFPALVGFFSVSFRSCSKDTYEEIIADRDYLIETNKEELSTSVFHIVVALFVWGVIAAGAVYLVRNKHENKD